MRTTDIVELVSGFEERNATVFNSRRFYDASMGIRNVNDLHDVIEFWEARFGQLYGFRWKDWADYKSCRTASLTGATDQRLQISEDGSTAFFQKTYSSGGHSYVRPIKKLVQGTVKMALNGVALSEAGLLTDESGNHLLDEDGNRIIDTSASITTFTVDHNAGTVVFNPPLTPDEVVTAGFEFDVPVRFDVDRLTISIDAFNHGSVPTIGIREIRI